MQVEIDRKKEEAVSRASELTILSNRAGEWQSSLKAREVKVSELERANESLKYKINSFDTYLE